MKKDRKCICPQPGVYEPGLCLSCLVGQVRPAGETGAVRVVPPCHGHTHRCTCPGPPLGLRLSALSLARTSHDSEWVPAPPALFAIDLLLGCPVTPSASHSACHTLVAVLLHILEVEEPHRIVAVLQIESGAKKS